MVGIKWNILFIVVFYFFTLSISDAKGAWIKQRSNNLENLKGIFFIDSLKGWCVGDSGVALFTENGGATWINRHNLGKCYDIYFKNESTGFASSEKGVIYKTTNGGNTWTMLRFDSALKFSKIIFCPNSYGYIAANRGYVLITEDGGDTSWRLSRIDNVPIGAKAVVTEVFSLSGRSVDAYGYAIHNSITSYFRAHSSDFGRTWTILAGGTYDVQDIEYRFDNKGCKIWSKNRIRTEYNDEFFYPQNSTKKKLHEIAYGDTDQVWIVGDSVILKSTDGGITFSKDNLSPGKLTSVFFVNRNHGWTCGERGEIYKYEAGSTETARHENRIKTDNIRCQYKNAYRSNGGAAAEYIDFRGRKIPALKAFQISVMHRSDCPYHESSSSKIFTKQ